MIDFHCHLDLYPQPAKIVAEARRRAMFLLAVTTTPRAFEGNLRFVGSSGRIRVAVGLHPELAEDRHGEVDLVCRLMKRTRYVGEVGLDGSPDHRSSLDVQRRVLGRILAACRDEGGKVVSMHSRMAAPMVLDEIERAGAIGTPVLHWFSGTVMDVARAAALGCWFSVGPAMLASRKGANLAASMPADRVLTETDGPFGQVAGRPLEPWDVGLATRRLADVWSVDFANAEARLVDNLRTLVAMFPEFESADQRSAS